MNAHNTNTVAQVCGVPQGVKIQYCTHTCNTCFWNTVGLPAPMLHPISLSHYQFVVADDQVWLNISETYPAYLLPKCPKFWALCIETWKTKTFHNAQNFVVQALGRSWNKDLWYINSKLWSSSPVYWGVRQITDQIFIWCMDGSGTLGYHISPTLSRNCLVYRFLLRVVILDWCLWVILNAPGMVWGCDPGPLGHMMDYPCVWAVLMVFRVHFKWPWAIVRAISPHLKLA